MEQNGRGLIHDTIPTFLKRRRKDNEKSPT
jgi:hypothetical protein